MRQPASLFFLLVLGLGACVKNDFCIQPSAVKTVVRFKHIDSTNKKVDSAFDNITIFLTDSSYLYYDDISSVKQVQLYLRPNANRQVMVFKQEEEPFLSDTITIKFESILHFISNGCGYQYYFNLTEVSSTHHLIQEAVITRATVTESIASENIEILFK